MCKSTTTKYNGNLIDRKLKHAGANKNILRESTAIIQKAEITLDKRSPQLDVIC